MHFSREKYFGNKKTITPLQPKPSIAKEIDIKTKW
jgi:hypothetical protein